MDIETSNGIERVDISLLVCTFNRSKDLRELLETAIGQDTHGEFKYEVIVVDNNSSDNTRDVVKVLIAAGHENVRYVFEGQQGKSYALNSGLAELRAPLYVIVDDDFILPPNWVYEIVKGFRSHPEVSFVSGKVLPLWETEPPDWLTQEHWAAIAMADYGEKEFIVDKDNQLCLLACAFRTADVKAVGGYRQELGVTKNQIGGTEDLELLQRLWSSDRAGIYLPHLWFHHKVSAHRCTKKHHRRWHTGHGGFYAAMRDEDFERSKARFFDIPSHVYKEGIKSSGRLLVNLLAGRSERAFMEETKLRFVSGFIRKRLRDFNSGKSGSFFNEMRSLLDFMLKRTD